MRKKIWTVPLLILTALYAVSAGATDVSLTASNWQLTSSVTGVPGATLLNDANGALYFDFPEEEVNPACMNDPHDTDICNTVNYLRNPDVSTSIISNACGSGPCMLSITLQVQTLNGTPVYNFTGTGGSIPPSVRAIVSGVSNSNDTERYWSNEIYYTLGPGTVTMNVPLDARYWSDVGGQWADHNNGTENQFNNALGNLDYLGVTFGGGNTFPHGIFTTGGAARFTLQSYKVIPVPNCPSVTGTQCNGTTCLPGALFDTDLDLYQCVQPGGSLLECNIEYSPGVRCTGEKCPQFHVISQNCNKAPCCTTFPFCFGCPSGSCAGVSNLECACDPGTVNCVP